MKLLVYSIFLIFGSLRLGLGFLNQGLGVSASLGFTIRHPEAGSAHTMVSPNIKPGTLAKNAAETHFYTTRKSRERPNITSRAKPLIGTPEVNAKEGAQ